MSIPTSDPAYSPSFEAAAAAGIPFTLRLRPGSGEFQTDVPAAQVWAWLRQLLLERPEQVAQMVGIPEVSRLADLPPRRPALKLLELVNAYETHAEVTAQQRRNVRRIAEDFIQVTGTQTVGEITPERAGQWEAVVKGRRHGPVTVRTYFQRLKTVLSFGRKRGFDPAQIRGALDACAILTPPKNPNPFNPHPIDRLDYKRLLRAAQGWERAFLLLALNACLYAAEVLNARWSELDLDRGLFVTNRGKTSVVRAAVLWPRTIEALKALHRGGSDSVFVSSRGSAFHPNSLRKIFENLRLRAKVLESVKFSDIRDGAYSAAVESGCERDLCRILAGHRCGMSDHYVKRRPSIVAQACRAVEVHYFGKRPRRPIAGG